MRAFGFACNSCGEHFVVVAAPGAFRTSSSGPSRRWPLPRVCPAWMWVSADSARSASASACSSWPSSPSSATQSTCSTCSRSHSASTSTGSCRCVLIQTNPPSPTLNVKENYFLFNWRYEKQSLAAAFSLSGWHLSVFEYTNF